ncbi:MAG: 23S rRNA (guanosine(2251)-2'-O)-methyltransferase RlmB [Bacteroidales bacterium]|nr:23S rRNA (guanosine(2251)-2'-O)-methyltransferase RlmB [Bacteroidales bacterium]
MNQSNQESQDMIYGTRPLMEAIRSGKEIEKVLLQHGIKTPVFHELMSLLKEHEIPFQWVPVEKLNRITRKNHQGVIATVSPVSFYKIDQILPSLYEQGDTPFILVLDRVTDIRNFGGLLRTAESAGVHAVLVPDKGTAPLNSDAVKSSAGAVFKVPICREHNLKDSLTFLKESGLKVVAVTEKADHYHFRENLTGPVALLMGSEGTGISEAYLKLTDVRVKIPMLGTIESLNVSVAAGILMHEVVRQRMENDA